MTVKEFVTLLLIFCHFLLGVHNYVVRENDVIAVTEAKCDANENLKDLSPNRRPEGRPWMSDLFTSLSGISGLSLDSPFLSPLFFSLFFSFCLVLLLFPSCHFVSAGGPFSGLKKNSYDVCSVFVCLLLSSSEMIVGRR